MCAEGMVVLAEVKEVDLKRKREVGGNSEEGKGKWRGEEGG